MKIFYDTEFWERGPDKPITMISIGAVREDGAEFYLINHDAPLTKIANESPWLRTNVLSYLPVTVTQVGKFWTVDWDESHPDIKHARQFDDIGSEFYRFANHGPGSIELWARWGGYDHVVLSQLYGRMIDKPADLPWYTKDLQQEVDRLGNSPLPSQTEGLHRALDDARHVKVVYDHLFCAHCGGIARGYATKGDQRLCHPNEGLDCYHLVTVYKHDTPCQKCTNIRRNGERG